MKEKKQNLFFETERLINSIINEANTYINTLYNYSEEPYTEEFLEEKSNNFSNYIEIASIYLTINYNIFKLLINRGWYTEQCDYYYVKSCESMSDKIIEAYEKALTDIFEKYIQNQEICPENLSMEIYINDQDTLNFILLEDQICAFSDNLKEIIYNLNRTITIFNDLYRINNLTIDSDIEENIILIDELFNEYILKFKGLISKD